MSGLSDVFSDLVKGITTQGGENVSPLSSILAQVLNNTKLGGIGGLLAELQTGGLASQVTSWLGDGKNMPVSPDQLRSALGSEHVHQLATQSGLPINDLLAALSKSLPGIVDHLSPSGRLQEPVPMHDGDEPEAPEASLEDQAGLNNIR